MAIRIRTVGSIRVALCAAETDSQLGDVYLDDDDHYALAAKFSQDRRSAGGDAEYPDEWAAAETQRLRDAKTELERWLDSGSPDCAKQENPA